MGAIFRLVDSLTTCKLFFLFFPFLDQFCKHSIKVNFKNIYNHEYQRFQQKDCMLYFCFALISWKYSSNFIVLDGNVIFGDLPNSICGKIGAIFTIEEWEEI